MDSASTVIMFLSPRALTCLPLFFGCISVGVGGGEGRGCYSELGDSPAVSSSMLIESGERSWLQTSDRDGSLNGGKQLCVRKLLAQKPQT